MMLFLTILFVLTIVVTVSLGIGYLWGRTVRRTDEEWARIMSYEHLQAGEEPPPLQ